MKNWEIPVTEPLSEQGNGIWKIFKEGKCGVAKLDAGLRFIELNEAFCLLLGYSQQELKGLTVYDITYADHHTKDNMELNRLLTGEIPFYKSVKHFIRKDNKIIRAAVTISIIHDMEGQFIYFLELIEKLTGNNRNDQIQQKSKEIHLAEPTVKIFTPMQLLTIVSSSIFVSEVLVISILSVLPPASYFVNLLVNASLLLIVLFPILYFFSYRSRMLYLTKHKKTEDELLKFRLGIECSDEVIFMTDSDGTILYVNPTFEKTYGYEKEETIGKTPRLLKSGSNSEETYSKFWQTLKEKKRVSGEIRNKTKDGRIITIESSANPILNDSGDLIGFLAVQRDISKRKQTLQIRKVLFNISNAVLTSKDQGELAGIIREQIGTLIDTSNFNIVFFDKATDMLTAIYNKDDKEKIRSWPAGKSLTGYVIKHKKPLLLTKEVYLELYRHKRIDLVGTIAEVWLGVPLIGEKEVIGAFVVQSYNDPNAYDLDDLDTLEFISNQIAISLQHKKSILDLKAALSKAKESDQLKSAFLSTMNHELRTPLHQILGFSELILSGVETEEVMDFASSIQTSGENLLSIIQDIFDLALVEQVRIKLRKQTFDLMDHFRENKIFLEDILRTSGKDEHIKLIFNPDTELLSRYVTADRSKINQVLGNLLKNAVKFTDKGSIEFGCKLIDQSMLMFYDKDTGIGIPKEKHAIIFELFRQVDDSDTRPFGGLGIGLSISLKIARILNGELTVESEPGGGSTFCLSIPVEISNPDDQIISTLHEVNAEFNLEGKNILIVEDNRLSLAIVKSFLGVTRARIFEASDGREAIGMWHNHPEIDLILMDLKMAGMDGFEATRILKAEKPDLPIIALTAYTLDSDKPKAFKAGCNGIIKKPVSRQHLFSEIKKILGNI